MGDEQDICQIINVMGKKWSIPIIRELDEEPSSELSYMDLKRRLEEVSSKSLSEQLKQLVDIDLVERREVNKSNPRRVNYLLTDNGIRIWDILGQIGSKNIRGS